MGCVVEGALGAVRKVRREENTIDTEHDGRVLSDRGSSAVKGHREGYGTADEDAAVGSDRGVRATWASADPERATYTGQATFRTSRRT
jgi:hypothetical protein